MSNQTKLDPVAELAQLRERGAAHLAHLRQEAAERRSELDKIDREEAVRLHAAEVEFSQQLAQREREERLKAAHEEYAAAQLEYTKLVAAADEPFTDIERLTGELADAYARAIRAEHQRVTAGEELRDLVRTKVTPIDPQIAEPAIAPKRAITGGELDHIRAIAESRHHNLAPTVEQLRRHHPKRLQTYRVQDVEHQYWA